MQKRLEVQKAEYEQAIKRHISFIDQVSTSMHVNGLICTAHCMLTSSSAMAERPRELDQRFQVGERVSLRLNYRLKGYFWRHCDMTQFTLTHHMVNKPFSSTRPSCWIQISTVDWMWINVAADHQMFMTLTGELSWQRLRRSAVDFYSKTRKNARWAAMVSGLWGNIHTPSMARRKARIVDFIFVIFELRLPRLPLHVLAR